MSHLPGFEVFREGSKDERILHDAVLTKLTRTLGEWTFGDIAKAFDLCIY